jgi:hypothetical protein
MIEWNASVLAKREDPIKRYQTFTICSDYLQSSAGIRCSWPWRAV